MRDWIMTVQGSRVSVRLAVLLLLAVSLAIPQLGWADHTSGAPDWQAWRGASDGESISGSVDEIRWQARNGSSSDDAGDNLGMAELYARGFSSLLAREADEAAAAGPELGIAGVVASSFAGIMAREADEDRTAVRSVGLLARSFSSSANAEDASAARWAAIGSYYAERAAAASAARWAALGAFYGGGEAFIAANPEVGAYERFAAREGCIVASLAC